MEIQDVVHGLRNELNKIAVSDQTLLTDYRLDSKVSKRIQYILDSAMQMDRLLKKRE